MDDLAELLKSGTPLAVRVGVVVEVLDATRAQVNVGERVIGVAWPLSLGAPKVGAGCTIMVGDGVARVVSSDQPPPTPVPYRMASGSTTLTFSGTNSSAAVTFPAGRFSVEPRFMVALRESRQIIISATDETTSGGTIRGTTINGATYSGSVPVAWVAWQMTPTSKD